MRKSQIIFPFSPLISAGSWIVASPEDPLLQPEQSEAIEWVIEMPATEGAWIPFHLIGENFRVSQHEF